MPFSWPRCVQYSSITVSVRLNECWWFLWHKRSDCTWFIDIQCHIETMTSAAEIGDGQEVVGSANTPNTHTFNENPVSWSAHIYLCAINRLRLCMFLIDSNGSSPIWLPDISKNLNDCVIELELHEMGKISKNYVYVSKMENVCGACVWGRWAWAMGTSLIHNS